MRVRVRVSGVGPTDAHNRPAVVEKLVDRRKLLAEELLGFCPERFGVTFVAQLAVFQSCFALLAAWLDTSACQYTPVNERRDS